MKRTGKSLAQNAVLNAIKQSCVIIFPILVFPYVSRVLGSSNYGKVNFSTSIIAYVSLIAGLGIRNYAIREGARIRNNKEKINEFVSEIYTINFFSTIVSYIGLFFLYLFWSKLSDYSILIVVLSLSTLFTTLGTDWINTIYEDYLYITIRYIVCHSLSVICIFIFVRSREDYVLYALISVFAEILANILNIYHIRKVMGIYPRIVFHKGMLVHFKPIFLIFGTAIATKIYVNSDITILGIFCSDSDVGNYSVAARIYSLVKQLVNALMIVAVPRISYMMSSEEEQKIKERLSSIFEITLITVMPASVGLFFLRNEIVLVLSGNEYTDAITPLGILSFSLICACLSCFFVNVVMLPNKMEKKIFMITIISAATNIVLNFILIPNVGIKAAAITTLLSEGLILLLGVIYSHRYISIRKNSVICCLLNCAFVIFVCICVKEYVSNLIMRMIFSVCLSFILFGLVVLAFYKKKIFVIFGLKKR